MRYVVVAVPDEHFSSVVDTLVTNLHVDGTKEVFLDELDEDTFDTATLLT